MRSVLLKWLVAVVVLVVGIGGLFALNATAKQADEKKKLDTRPIVEVESISPSNYQVMIHASAEVKPQEVTRLAAQVTGEVTGWHPNFVAGGIVKRGDVLFSIERDNYQAAVLQAEAEVARAEAALIQEKAQAQVAKTEASRTPKIKRSPLFLREPQMLSAQAAVKSANASLKRAQRDLANCQVRAPFDALIVSRDIGVGQFVSTGSAVATLNNIETAEVIVPIAGFDSAFLPNKVAGLNATVSTQGFNSITRQGEIVRDLGVIDSDTRMSNLVVRINNPYAINSALPALKFGTYVNVQFAGQSLNAVYRLPQELVNNQTVWVVNKDQQLEPRKVKVLREEQEYFFVSDGLQQGDQVVTTVPEYPLQGMEVRIAGEDDSQSAADPAPSAKQ